MRSKNDEYLYSRSPGYLHQGGVSIEQFRLLSDISNIYSERILNALELYLVRGYERREACDKTGISQSCFSIKLRRIQDVSRIVVALYPWYCNVPRHPDVNTDPRHGC